MVFPSNSQISKRKLILKVYLREDSPNAIPLCSGDKNAISSLATKHYDDPGVYRIPLLEFIFLHFMEILLMNHSVTGLCFTGKFL